MNALERLRYDAGMTRLELASKSGVSLSTIIRTEEGRTSDLRAPSAAAIARVFDMTGSELVLALRDQAPEAA